mmetsp:Transcript_32220/g.59257  ORF Transcript_32220/g.59257 Transcript_32220/m.59257 type:complete len:104 (-) Transcript_32220:237-548(-)
MVKVWYEPPPYGVGTTLNRPSYGLGAENRQWLIRLSKMPSWQVVGGACAVFVVAGYIPTMFQEKLPFTMSPEYVAANRAYMRYHNMNPIWGISSKKAREADAH